MTEFTTAYLVASLWASTDDNQNPLDDNYNFDSFAPEALARMEADCEQFQAENAELLAKAYPLYVVIDDSCPESYAGHDFWLTRAGHGCGWWDRGMGELGEQLTEATRKWKEINLYVGDDLLIHIM